MWDFEDIVRMGSDFEKEEPAQSEALLKGPQLDDIALMVFTSGSTGKPKAAMMSWRGLGCAAQGLNSMLGCTHQHSLVSYLPLCHVAEQYSLVYRVFGKNSIRPFNPKFESLDVSNNGCLNPPCHHWKTSVKNLALSGLCLSQLFGGFGMYSFFVLWLTLWA
jgi:hypothetical protein